MRGYKKIRAETKNGGPLYDVSDTSAVTRPKFRVRDEECFLLKKKKKTVYNSDIGI